MLLQTCRTDGYLLKPDQPAVYLDVTYAWAFTDLMPRIVFDTVSKFMVADVELEWHYVVSANLTTSFNITPEDLGYSNLAKLFVFDWHNAEGTLRQFSASAPLALPANVIPPPNNATSANCTFAPCWQV